MFSIIRKRERKKRKHKNTHRICIMLNIKKKENIVCNWILKTEKNFGKGTYVCMWNKETVPLRIF